MLAMPGVISRAGLRLTASPEQQQRADQVMEGRQRGKHLAPASTSIGSAALDRQADWYGALAEICVYQALEALGWQPRYTLLAARAVVAPDMTLFGYSYEIKCSPPGRQTLNLSTRQHQDPRRRADFYLPVLYTGKTEMVVCHPVPWHEVVCWPIRQGHEPYHSLARTRLRPLYAWEYLRWPCTDPTTIGDAQWLRSG